MRRIAVVALAGLLSTAACSSGASRGKGRAAAQAALAIAEAEVRRAAGVAALATLARDGSTDAPDRGVDVRALARRGLGRVGTPDAIAGLRSMLSGEPVAAASAAAALGVAVALGDADAAIAADLLTAAARRDIDRAVVLEALGRAGDGAALATLAAALADPDPRVAAGAGIALGRVGRREIALDAATRAALIPASALADRDARYAATYALSREFRPAGAAPSEPAVIAALRARLTDADGEIRAVAVAGLGRRGNGEPGPLLDLLHDRDWRVAVEAMRALAGTNGSDAGRDAVAVHMVREWSRVLGAVPGASPHPILEGLRLLTPHGARPAVRVALGQLVGGARGGDPLVAGWGECLALAALARPMSEGVARPRPAAPPQAQAKPGAAEPPRPAPAPAEAFAALASCGPGLPAHHRRTLLAEAVAAGAGGSAAARWTVLTDLLADRDARVVVAALGAVAPSWATLEAGARDAAVRAIADRLGDADTGIAGAAAEASGALLATELEARRAALAAALIARASRPATDAELAAALLAALAAGRVVEGRDVCARAHTSEPPAVAAAGRACITALTGSDPGPGPASTAAPARPPVPVADVIGRRVTWTVETSRGIAVIRLDPSIAPWHVAAVTTLTQRGFYDGLIFHRVVPDFVVQGGDPAGAGWGGPGFTLPSEPAGGQVAGAPTFRRGAVGIADAGKDTGGSQWFVMHSRAPHLEGRYTWIGEVVSGQEAIDALVVGDRIVRATVALE